MQTAHNYTETSSKNTHSLNAQATVQSKRPPLTLFPATKLDIDKYVEQLLTQEEQAICDMATD